jgi:hypothetical protein
MQIELAAYGWDSPAWSTFYPEDLPQEWRLDYYSNEFTSLVVPAAVWAGVSIDEAAGWLEDAPAGFRFYWELDGPEGASRLLELASKHGGADSHLAGWLIPSGLILEHDLIDALSRSLPGAGYGQRPVGSDQAEQLAAQGITLCWQDELALNCRGRGLRVLQIHQAPDLRALRRTVEEQCTAGVEHLLLLVEPNPQTVPALRTLQTFTRLFNG